MMNRTRLSLLYLASYLAIIGFGLLFAPRQTLRILQSNQDYGDIFPRVSGMLMSGLGLSVFGMIRARNVGQYPATIIMRIYFLVCIAAFYAMNKDPFFLVLGAIVLFGLILTTGSFIVDRSSSVKVHQAQ